MPLRPRRLLCCSAEGRRPLWRPWNRCPAHCARLPSHTSGSEDACSTQLTVVLIASHHIHCKNHLFLYLGGTKTTRWLVIHFNVEQGLQIASAMPCPEEKKTSQSKEKGRKEYMSATHVSWAGADAAEGPGGRPDRAPARAHGAAELLGRRGCHSVSISGPSTPAQRPQQRHKQRRRNSCEQSCERRSRCGRRERAGGARGGGCAGAVRAAKWREGNAPGAGQRFGEAPYPSLILFLFSFRVSLCQ